MHNYLRLLGWALVIFSILSLLGLYAIIPLSIPIWAILELVGAYLAFGKKHKA